MLLYCYYNSITLCSVVVVVVVVVCLYYHYHYCHGKAVGPSRGEAAAPRVVLRDRRENSAGLATMYKCTSRCITVHYKYVVLLLYNNVLYVL